MYIINEYITIIKSLFNHLTSVIYQKNCYFYNFFFNYIKVND